MKPDGQPQPTQKHSEPEPASKPAKTPGGIIDEWWTVETWWYNAATPPERKTFSVNESELAIDYARGKSHMDYVMQTHVKDPDRMSIATFMGTQLYAPAP